MCPACWRGSMAAGPDGVRDPVKHGCGFESRCNTRVFWIVGSTDRHLIQLFHPGTNARPGGFRAVVPFAATRGDRDPCRLGHLVCLIAAEAARRFDRLKLAKI